MVKGVFGGASDALLRELQNLLSECNKNNTKFPISKIVKKFKNSRKDIRFTNENIRDLLYYEYKSPQIFSILSSLYLDTSIANQGKPDIDHIHPQAFFSDAQLAKIKLKNSDKKFYRANCNRIGNLQLLSARINRIEKRAMPFEDWLKKYYSGNARKDFMKDNFIPRKTSLEFKRFKIFVRKRDKLIRNKLKENIKF